MHSRQLVSFVLDTDRTHLLLCFFAIVFFVDTGRTHLSLCLFAILFLLVDTGRTHLSVCIFAIVLFAPQHAGCRWLISHAPLK